MAAEAAKEPNTRANKVVGAAEAKIILSGLAREADPNIRVRAIEGLTKLEDRETELGRAPDNDGFGEWRVVRDSLQMANGALRLR